MTQPRFAPIAIEDEVRPSYKLEVPRPWTPHRPGEFDPRLASGQRDAGPDQGYLALLAERFVDRLVLVEGEQVDDVLSAAIAIGMSRAALFGRAPVAKDLEFAFSVFGYLAPAEGKIVDLRGQLVAGVTHDLWRRGQLVEQFSDEALRMTPEQAVSANIWTQLTAA